jgi:hypothetical protein
MVLQWHQHQQWLEEAIKTFAIFVNPCTYAI